MKKKLFKVVSMMLTVAMLGTSVNLAALAADGDVNISDLQAEASENTEYENGTTGDDEENIEENSTYSVSNPRKSNDVVTWDCVYLGKYIQDDSVTKSPIKWRVLSVAGDDAFLMADQVIDYKKYNETESDVTWSSCTLRTWLNGDFYNEAFNTLEQAAIKEVTVVNNDNELCETSGGPDTSDKIYLLSIEEACNEAYGFSTELNANDKARGGKATQPAMTKGLTISSEDGYSGNCIWSLRSPGNNQDWAAHVEEKCTVDIAGNTVNKLCGIRPVLHIDLRSSCTWRYVGTVTSTGAENFVDPDPIVYPEYTVTFDANGGICSSQNKTVRYNSSYGDLPIPEKTGYTFLGWFEEKDAGKQIKADTVVTKIENHTLYAGWKADNTVASPRISDSVVTWDCIYFGSYWQNDINGDNEANTSDEKEQILWRVLSVDGDDALIIADKILDGGSYNTENISVTWESSTLRTWLNDDFYNAAFSSTEQAAIKTTEVINDDNSNYTTSGGNNTSDKIYLLSIDEARKSSCGFSRCNSTEYALEKGIEVHGGYPYWWLRSPGQYTYNAACVYSPGLVYEAGNNVAIKYGIRPVLHIDLQASNIWSYAGTVDSLGNEDLVNIECTVTFNANGGTCSQTDKTVNCYSAYGELPVPTREGYTFLGWFSGEKSGLQITSDTVMRITVAHTLYAHWKEDGTVVSPQKSYNVVTWDCIYFGNYWQNNSETKEPIKWRVLSVDGDDAFLIADQALDYKKYNEENTSVTWESSSLRTWLNGDFYNEAFKSTEQAAIKTITVDNNDNALYETSGGNTTSDKIYLLSIDEAANSSYGFNTTLDIKHDGRICKSTEYAKNNGSMTSNYCQFWLRSPGSSTTSAAMVNDGGYVYRRGYNAYDSLCGVRPVLHINLKASGAWSTAGTVNSSKEYGYKGLDAVVTFDAQGGTCDLLEKLVTLRCPYGDLPVPEKQGYTFLGWFSKSEQITADTIVQSQADITLRAGWKADDYTVSFDANGGACNQADKEVTFNSKYGELPVPERDGYTFLGWFAEKNAGIQVTADTDVNRAVNHTLYAHWKEEGTVVAPRISSSRVTWDCVYFGSYWQNDTDGGGLADTDDSKESIKWRVLYVDGDDAFLLADQALDRIAYNDTNTSVTWETCTLRNWLNGDFYNAAFNSTEQAAIKTTTVVNDDNSSYLTEGGNNTFDKVYLLSIDEMCNSAYGFINDSKTSDKRRECKATYYSKRNSDFYDNCNWWLRSPGDCSNSNHAAYVNYYGFVLEVGGYVGNGDYAVRPALHINLKSDTTWSYAGTVASDGSEYAVNPVSAVTFDAAGGTCDQLEKTVTYGEAYGELPVPVRENYTFLGWFTKAEAGEAVKAETVVRKAVNHTLYAHWKGNEYKITFDAAGGACDKAEATVTYGSAYGELPVPAKKCGIFLGWFTEKEAGTLVTADTVVKTAENHSLYAHWSTKHTQVEDAAVAPTCTKKGKTAGSHCSVCGEVFKAQEEIKALGHSFDEGVVTKEPTYDEEGIKTYTCTICKATEERKIEKIEKPAETIVIGDTEYTIAIEVRDTEGKILTGIDMSDKITVKGKKVVFAKAKDMKLTGYTFKGWKLDGKKITSIKTVNVTDNMTLVAEFAENTYDIVYKLTKPAKGVKVKGKIPTLKKNKYTEEVTLSDGSELTVKGYRLIGWTKEKKGTELQHAAGATVQSLTEKNKGKVVLYPVWEKVE